MKNIKYRVITGLYANNYRRILDKGELEMLVKALGRKENQKINLDRSTNFLDKTFTSYQYLIIRFVGPSL